ncbi:MAG: MFS transporter [Anaerolineae bacterium]
MTDKGKAWAVAAAVIVAGIVLAINRFKVPPILPVLMDELQVDMVVGGWLTSGSSVAGIFLAIPVAFLLARIGLKATGLVALGCAVAGAVIGGVAATAPVMLLGRMIEGVSVSLITVLAPTAISLWFAPRDRGLPMGIWAAWLPIGIVVVFNAAHPLMNALGWRSLWWFGAVLDLLAFVLVGLVVASPPEDGAGKKRPSAPPGELARMLLNPTTWLLAFSFAAFGFALLAYNTWAPTYLIETLRVEPGAASFYASLMFLAAIPANIVAGWVMDRMKDRYSLLPAAFLITTILFFWSFRLGSVGVVVPYMIVLGLASNFIPTVTFTLAPETMPRIEYAGLSVGMVMAGTNVGGVSGPPALGAILSAGNWSVGGTCFFLVMSLGTLAAWHVARRLRAGRTEGSGGA